MRFIVSAAPDFVGAALDELGERDASVRVERALAPGVVLLEADDTFAGTVVANPPVFVRHLMPVHAAVALTDGTADIVALAAAVDTLTQLDLIAAGSTFAVQARIVSDRAIPPNRPYGPGDLRAAIAPLVAARRGASEQVKAPQTVVSLLLDDTTAFVGVSAARDNLSDWPGGQHRFARESDQISRAEFKLLEALAVFGRELPAGGTALDLGAAPGGWTRVLLLAGLDVVAIDPAALDPRLARFGQRVRHVPGQAQAFLAQARRDRARDHFAVILCDIRIDALGAAQLMIRAADVLTSDGFALVTLKLPRPGRGVAPRRLLTEALDLLGRRYGRVVARQLFHNRHEVTALLIP